MGRTALWDDLWGLSAGKDTFFNFVFKIHNPMNYIPTTIGQLFDSRISFTIPVYQRAYSWEESNWSEFFEDIIGQIQRSNGYSYGNILLEIITEGEEYEIIDGQQRLTTLIIFMRSLINVLREKGYNQCKIEEMESDYIIRRGIQKLRPVDYDCACFYTIIIKNEKYNIQSNSQEKYQQCKDFFTNKLNELDLSTLEKIIQIITNTKINRLELQDKKESALMFELQNNRGKSLTNLEKLKSYFMYETYVNSLPEETNSNVETISNYFKEIYKTVFDIKGVNEDSVLIYHCNAYLSMAFAYRSLDDIKKEYKKEADKIKWIRDFCCELSKSFHNLKLLESNTSIHYKHLKDMRLPAFVYPFIIKGYKFFGDNSKQLDILFHIMEILAFRFYLIGSRAELNSRLSDILRDFAGDIACLRDSLKKKLNDTWYWGDSRTEEFLKGWMYENRMLHYLLWQYEGHIQNKGYFIGTCEIKDEQIEHISPQTPPEGESLAAGYEVGEDNMYSVEFKERYLNCIGNLMLISPSHNASIGNKPFAKKLATYKSNPLLKQQAEIPDYLDGNEKWMTEQIKKRRDAIVGFATKQWSFDAITI